MQFCCISRSLRMAIVDNYTQSRMLCALARLCKTKLAVVIESQASLTFQCWKLANQSHTSLSLSSPNLSERMWTSPDLVSLSNGDCRPRLRWLHAIAAEFTTSMISNISIIAFIKSNAIFFCFNIWFSLFRYTSARARSKPCCESPTVFINNVSQVTNYLELEHIYFNWENLFYTQRRARARVTREISDSRYIRSGSGPRTSCGWGASSEREQQKKNYIRPKKGTRARKLNWQRETDWLFSKIWSRLEDCLLNSKRVSARAFGTWSAVCGESDEIR